MFPKLALSTGLIWCRLLPLAAQPTPQPPKPPAPPATVVRTAPNPTPPKPVGPQGTISGLVVQKGSKTPIEGAQVLMVGPNGSQAGSRSDPEGKFVVKVSPGGYQITVRLVGQTGFIGVPTVKVVTVRVDEETKTEIELPKAAELSGRVLDARGEPVQGARVTLLMRSYELWSTNLIYMDTPFRAQTNDLGEYSFEGVPTDIAFHAFAEIVTPGKAEELAVNAANPDQRRPILAGTFYPQAVDPSGAQSLTLNEGERREGMDIRMVQTKSYCAQGALIPAQTNIPHTIDVDLNVVVSGVFNGYGSFRSGRIVSLDKDGQARVCGLWPGSYRFSVQPQSRRQGQGEYYGRGEFIITDKDLDNLTAKIGPNFNWDGEVTLEGPAPGQPLTQPMMVGFTNITPTSLGLGIPSQIPGTFTLPNLHFDRELLRFANLPDGWYVKRAMWGTQDLTQNGGRFMLDRADTPLRVVVAQDGGRFRVTVTDGDGQPAAGKRVNLIPGNLTSAQQLTARLWSCYSDNKGDCMVFSLPNETPRSVFAPGDYVVLAADIPYNQSSDVMDQFWRTIQTKGTRIKLPASSTGEASIKLEVLR
ncbi:MAG: carboxypeptidase regulatory-like domain-containing protein [Acidobacteriota bacterium]